MHRTLFAFITIAALVVAVPAMAQGPWYARGGHYNGWAADAGNQLNDLGLNGDAVAADGIFSGLVACNVPAGVYEFKIALIDWSTSYPGSNVKMQTTVDNQVVFFSLDTNAHGDGWYPDQNIVWSNALRPGTIWRLVGSSLELGNWDPAAGPQAYLIGSFFDVFLEFAAPGDYQYKWTADNAWDVQQMGFDGVGSNAWNVPLGVPAGSLWVHFQMDPNSGRARHTFESPTPVAKSTWGAVKGLYR
jgi:hypothetical protein